MSFYAYIHCKPDGTPFYVGKGNASRVRKINRPQNAHHTNILAKYGRENILVGKLECSSEEIAFDLEKGLLKRLRAMGSCLANFTDGGEGVSGLKMSEAAKQKMRDAKVGKPLSAEHKEKLRIASTGKTLSPESRDKVRASKVGKPLSNQHKEKLSAAKAGKPIPRETAEKISLSLAGKWCWITDGFHSKMVKKNTEIPHGWSVGRTGRVKP